MVRALVLGLGVSLIALAPAAGRAAERQHHLGIAPTASLLRVKGWGFSPGVGATAMYTYGLTDQFNLMAEASHAFVGLGQDLQRDVAPSTMNRPSFVTTGGAGVSYVLDVLRWVPYGGVLLSGNLFGGGTMPSVVASPGAQLALGLDYQFSRHFVGGVGFRQHLFFTKLSDYPSYSSLFLKVEWQWGY